MKTLSQISHLHGEGRKPSVLPKISRLLVPTDLSAPSLRALEAAISLIRGIPRASITLVHVIEPMPTVASMDPGAILMAGGDQLAEMAAGEMARLQLKYGRGIKLTARVLMGSPVAELSEMVNMGHYDMAVMASHGRSGLRRLFLGSVAEGLIQRANCPVLVVKTHEGAEDVAPPRHFKNILVGYDGRAGAVAALEMAAEIGKRTEAHITLARAVAVPEVDGWPGGGMEGVAEDAALAEAAGELKKVKDACSPLSAGWDLTAEAGDSWDVLSDLAAKGHCDLVIVGPHGHSNRRLDFLGSTAQRLVRISPCSVLAVK